MINLNAIIIIEVNKMGLFDLFGKKESVTILGMEFPMFNGSKTWSDSRNTQHYQRKNYYYRIDQYKKDEYLGKLAEYGFIKATDIRYEKANAYVIVEEKDDRLHIAFHVKK